MSRRHTSPHLNVAKSMSVPSKMAGKRDERHANRHDGTQSKSDRDSSKKGSHHRGSSGSRSRRSHVDPLPANIADYKNFDFLCPVCLDLIFEAHITRCGHTFCYRCITNSVEMFKRCPKCSYTIATCDQIFPNHLLDELIVKFRIKDLKGAGKIHMAIGDAVVSTDGAGGTADADSGLKNFLTTESQKLTLPDVNIILGILNQRKQLLEAESSVSQHHLLYDFLKYLQFQRKKKKEQIENELKMLDIDLAFVGNILKDISIEIAAEASTPDVGAEKVDVKGSKEDVDEKMSQDKPVETAKVDEEVEKEVAIVVEDVEEEKEKEAEVEQPEKIEEPEGMADEEQEPPKVAAEAPPVAKSDQDNMSTVSHDIRKEMIETPAYNARKRRMLAHFDEFAKSYFVIRNQDLLLLDDVHEKDVSLDQSTAGGQTPSVGERKLDKTAGLTKFRETLVGASKYGSLRQLYSMYYSTDAHMGSTIVSTIVFDKDAEFFAIGGVTRRIKIFDYIAMIRDGGSVRYPVLEMTSKAKISCLSWNSHNKHILASSDYVGGVNVWDVKSGQQTLSFEEHKKRCWSVDFNDVDSRLIASGSDDGSVKLWSLNQPHSVATLETRANVCCVKFNPASSYHLAFGSADQDVHYYDMRHFSRPVAIFRGHKKAVSYVKFLNAHQIVSASTDSQLKCWNINEPPLASRTFHGHLNEKNFVGLSTNGDYVACGSEDNSVYVYYKSLSKPLFCFNMDVTASSEPSHSAFASSGRSSHATGFSSDSERLSDMNDFVSAVTWRNQTNAIVAANSRGIIKVLELV